MKGISLSFILGSAFIIALLSSLLMVHSSMAQQQQQQQFTASTTAKQVVDAYKAGVPFKNYIAAAIKNRESPEHTIIKNQMGSGD
jgi:Flp pilus assembly protein TadB